MDRRPGRGAGRGRRGFACSVRGASEDLASATVGFSSGLTANFNTSRLGQQKIRTLEITQADSMVTADLVRQDIIIHRMSHHEYLSDEGTRYRNPASSRSPSSSSEVSRSFASSSTWSTASSRADNRSSPGSMESGHSHSPRALPTRCDGAERYLDHLSSEGSGRVGSWTRERDSCRPGQDRIALAVQFARRGAPRFRRRHRR